MSVNEAQEKPQKPKAKKGLNKKLLAALIGGVLVVGGGLGAYKSGLLNFQSNEAQVGIAELNMFELAWTPKCQRFKVLSATW